MLFSEKTEGAWSEGRGKKGRKLEWKKGKSEENTKGKREGVRKGRKEMG